MKKRETLTIFCAVVFTCIAAGSASAGVIEFESKDEWIAAIGAFATVDFTGFPSGTVITNQYADLGVLFTDGNDSIHFTPSFVNDGWGLDGNGNITVAFDTPMAYIGVDFPGDLQIDLYADGRLIHSSVFFGGGRLLLRINLDAAFRLGHPDRPSRLGSGDRRSPLRRPRPADTCPACPGRSAPPPPPWLNPAFGFQGGRCGARAGEITQRRASGGYTDGRLLRASRDRPLP